jgi:hypothetical protein
MAGDGEEGHTMRVLHGVAVILAGAFVALLVYGIGSHPTSSFAEPTDAETGQAQRSSPDLEARDTDPNDAGVVTPVRYVDDERNGTVGEDRSHASFADENRTAARPQIDEETVRKRFRESAVRDIRDAYSLLFEDLGLTPQEKDDLFSFLVEVQIAGLTIYQRGKILQPGKTMDEDERLNRIAAIIGYPKLKRFLTLERHVATYSEVHRIGSLLERKGVPLTEEQRDGLFDILAATRNRDYATVPSADVERDSAVEQTLFRINERERHVIELAPSVLSPRQVVYLHAQYQHCSEERADDLERQRKRRADYPSEDHPLGYLVCGP